MKNFLRLIFVVALLFVSLPASMATEDIAEDLLENKQENEIVLNQEDPEKNNDFVKKDTKSFFIFNNDDDDVMDNTELDFTLLKLLDTDKSNDEISEDTLFGKIYHSKITRTDVPTFLLQDDLTFKPQKGPVKKIHTYGAYRGSLSSIWRPEYSTDYDNLTTQIGMYGQFKNPDYKFKLAVNPIPISGRNYIDSFVSDMYVVNTSIPNHQIVAGYSRVQTGVEGGTSTYILPFVARSQIARNFGSARSLALKVIGNYQYADYNFSVGSSGRYITSGMPGAEFNGWVNFKPLGKKAKKYGKVTIGAGYNGGHNRIDYNVASAYIGYHHKRLWSNIEAAIADGYNGSKGISSNKANGYAATVGWKFNPHFQLIGRVDQFDPNRNVSGDLSREYTIGLNWFIKGQALKFVLNYVFCDNQNRADSHKIIMATQIIF